MRNTPEEKTGPEMFTFARALVKYAFGDRKRIGEDKHTLHAFRVKDAVAHLGNNYAIVAILHDVIEDTTITYEMLRDLFNKEIALDVMTLTHFSEFDTYEEYIEEIARFGSDIALAVKLADIEDNLEPRGITDQTEGWDSYQALRRRYLKGHAKLRAEQVKREEEA